jgi:hypothetical protein
VVGEVGTGGVVLRSGVMFLYLLTSGVMIVLTILTGVLGCFWIFGVPLCIIGFREGLKVNGAKRVLWMSVALADGVVSMVGIAAVWM